MNDLFTIDIPHELKWSIEIKNILTSFLDKYNILLPHLDSQLYELHQTYIDIDVIDVKYLKSTDESCSIAFRLPGATRGSVQFKKIYTNSDDDKDMIRCEITSIDFIESSCFEVLKAYRRDVVKASNDEFVGKTFIININKR